MINGIRRMNSKKNYLYYIATWIFLKMIISTIFYVNFYHEHLSLNKCLFRLYFLLYIFYIHGLVKYKYVFRYFI